VTIAKGWDSLFSDKHITPKGITPLSPQKVVLDMQST